MQCHFMSQPISEIHGDVVVPGDKSISHRAVIFSSMAEGTSVINGFLESADCLATVAAFRAMGVKIEGPVDHRLVVHGVGKYHLSKPDESIDCGNSGTTMRLLAGLLAAQPFETVLIGDESLQKRPMARIAKPLTLMGAEINTTEGHAPLKLTGHAKLQGITYEIPELSAQVKSCLLLAALYAEGETKIVESGLTRDHTERMMTTFSSPIQKMDNGIMVNPDNQLQATDIMIPGDISSAAFFIVAATLIPGSELYIRNVGINPTRTGVLQILKQMGADISVHNKRLCGEEPVADLYVRHALLEGIDIPASMVPLSIDEFPIIFIAAAFAKGQTLLHGARELRFKESDRIAAMVEGLTALGIEAQGLEDGIYIRGGVMKGGVVNSQKDHRIAMAFSIAGAAAQEEIKILNCASVVTSFPNFLDVAFEAGMVIKKIDDFEEVN